MNSIPDKPNLPVNKPNVTVKENSHTVTEDTNTEELAHEIKVGISSLPYEARISASKLLALIGEDGVSEVLMNGPKEILFRKDGQRFFVDDIQFENDEIYHNVINYVILPMSNTADRIGTTPYLVEGQLEMPDTYDEENTLYARVHIVAPPAVKTAKVTIAKKARYQYNLDEVFNKGSLSFEMAAFLKALSRARVTTVISGLSGSGKTTLLEAMSFDFDTNDRIIVVEDTPEIRLPLEDVVYLPAHSAKPGQEMRNSVSVEWLAAQANRMRPDRIIIGECRGEEMSEFISAANSGADGSITTIHASSPRQALDKMLSLCMKSDDSKSEYSVLRDIATTVQIIIQTNLIEGKHVISQIEEISNTIRKEGSAIATTTLFEYDRASETFIPRNRPSEQLASYMANRGVAVDLTWFQ